MPNNLQKQPASTVHEANGQSIAVYWVPKNIQDSTASAPKHIGVLCTLQSFAEVGITPQYEAEIMGIGKTNSFVQSKEIKLEPFTLEFQGGDFKTLSFLTGRDPNSVTNNAPIIVANSGITGHLVIKVHNTSTGEHRGTIVIHDVEARIPSLSGITPDASLMHKVEFKSATGRVHYTQAGFDIAVEGWKAPNATAPDGAIVAFTLGTGNGAYATTTVPIALEVESADASRTGYKRFFTYLAVNGTEVSTASATFNNTTSVLTFGTAPATGTLLAFYVMSTASISPPNFYSGWPTLDVSSAIYAWQDYA